jgi:cob(I)alamin adenosyltransferase
MGTNSAIDEEEIEFLEEQLNLFNEELPDLKNFILPGGATASALAQLSRSVCRRCERSLVSLNEENTIEENKLIYINRLSDLLFVIARSINKEAGIEELLWKQTKLS